MTEQGIYEVNVDKIMKQIRAEVAKRKAEAPRRRPQDEVVYRTAPRPFTGPEVRESGLFRFAKQVQSRLRGYPFFDFLNNAAKRLKRFIPQHRIRMDVADFLDYQDREFIEHAYRGIWRREPDEQGLDNFLSKLRTGKLTRIEILGKLRYSAEGRAREIVVKGLLPLFILHSACRISFMRSVRNFMVSRSNRQSRKD